LNEEVAVLGGTGRLGKGLALRLLKEHDVTIGSRVKERALDAVKEVKARAESLYKHSGYKGEIKGQLNSDAAKENKIIILAIEADQLYDFLSASKDYEWRDKIVLSPVTRMKKTDDVFEYYPFDIDGTKVSAAEYIQHKLHDAEVISALHLVPASALWSLKELPSLDVPAAGKEDVFRRISKMFEAIGNLRFLYAGPLQVSYLIESALPLLLNIATRNDFKNAGIRVVT